VWAQGHVTFEIDDFAAAVAAEEKDEFIESKLCSIGGSQFCVQVYPSGDDVAAEDMVSIYTVNKSEHKVAFDLSMTVGDVEQWDSNVQVERKSKWGLKDFMERKEVGANLTVVVDITLLREQVITRGAIKIAECSVCLEELRPPLRIVQCLKGHKLCEPCSLKEEVVSCPLNCRAGFMGRDLGM